MEIQMVIIEIIIITELKNNMINISSTLHIYMQYI